VAELAIDDRCKRAEALEALRRGHAIMARPTALSPNNTGWKRDLDRFEARIAELSQSSAPLAGLDPAISEPFAAELRGPSNARLDPMCSSAP
jgi:hypothetical protein